MQFVQNILVVEDNYPDFVLLQEYLKMAVPEISSITNLQTIRDVIDQPKNNRPGLIFLDLNLPDSHGLETFLSVNSLFPFAPIIVLSGMQDTAIALQAIQAGAQDYLIKGDFDPKVLSKIIQYSIERKRNQIKLQESNTRYEIVSKATNDPVWDWDTTTDEIQWNDKVNIFGYPENIKKNGSWFEANIHPEDRDRVNSKLEDCLGRKDCEQWSDNYRFRCFDGTYRYILDRGYVIRDNEGKAIRFIGAMQDTTEQVVMQLKFEHEKAIQQKAILQATVEGQEKERTEIGKELHDNINQILASVKLLIGSVISQSPGDARLLNESLQLTDQCIQEIRSLSSSLVPLKEQEMNISEALQVIVNRIKKTSTLQFHLAIDNELVEKLNEKQQLTIYRILQEQINNILKHAMANEVTVSLTENDGNALLKVTDDGRGFDASHRADGIGLRNMKSRCELLNGTFLIESEPGNGCGITVIIPIAAGTDTAIHT